MRVVEVRQGASRYKNGIETAKEVAKGSEIKEAAESKRRKTGWRRVAKANGGGGLGGGEAREGKRVGKGRKGAKGEHRYG